MTSLCPCSQYAGDPQDHYPSELCEAEGAADPSVHAGLRQPVLRNEAAVSPARQERGSGHGEGGAGPQALRRLVKFKKT